MIESVSAQANRRQHLLINVRSSIYYHERRRDFFECLCPFWFIVGALVVSVVLVVELDNDSLKSIVAWVVISVFVLVVITALRARLHRRFMERYSGLENRLLMAPSHIQLQEIDDDRVFIKVQAPTVLVVLNCLCYNEVVQTMGYKNVTLHQVSWFQRLVAQLFDFRAAHLAFES